MVFAFAKAEAQDYQKHIVKSGETLSTISKTYQVDEAEIIKLNPDIKNGVSQGQVILLPAHADVLTPLKIVRYETHKVRRKETLYSLSKEYNVTELDIKEANKFLYATGLKKGDRIRIPVFEKQSISDSRLSVSADSTALNKNQYLVKPQDTFYGISKKFGVTVEELKSANKDIDHLKEGAIITIPTDDKKPRFFLVDRKEEETAPAASYRTYVVPSKMTWYSLEKKLGIPKDTILALNPFLKEGLKVGDEILIPNFKNEYKANATAVDLRDSIRDFNSQRIAIMLPLSLQKVHEEFTEEQHVKKDRALRIALDMLTGLTVAQDSARDLGIEVYYDVFDTQRSADRVLLTIGSNDFSVYDMVIGPLLGANVNIAAQELKAVGIPVVSPLSNGDIKLHSNLFQTRPNDALLKEKLFQYLMINHEGKNIIVVNDDKRPDLKNEIVSMFPQATFLKPNEDNYIFKQTYLNALSKTQENWVILAVENEGFITDAVSHYGAAAADMEITMFGYEDYEEFGLSNTKLALLNYTYPGIQMDQGVKSAFSKRYESKYGITPNKYAIRGFDIGMDLILRQSVSSSLFKSADDYQCTEQTENKFSYKKKFMAGYENTAIYLLQVQEDLSLKDLKL